MNEYIVTSSNGDEFKFCANSQAIHDGYACFYISDVLLYSFYNAISVEWKGLM